MLDVGDLGHSIRSSFRGASEASEPGIHNPQRCGVWIPGPRPTRVNALMGASRNDRVKTARAHRHHATPSFFCRLVDEVVYWNTSFFSG